MNGVQGGYGASTPPQSGVELAARSSGTRTDTLTPDQAVTEPGTRFSHLPVKIIMQDTEPKLFGAPAFDNSEILNARAWTVGAHINLFKVAVHLGRKFINATTTAVLDRGFELLQLCQGDPSATCFDRDILEAKLSLQYNRRILDLLGLATYFRNTKGTPEQWQEHMECIRKGQSNPNLSKVPEFSEFNDTFFDCIKKCDDLDRLTGSIADSSDRRAIREASSMQAALCDTVQKLYKSTVVNLETMTGYELDEILDLAFSEEDDFYIKGSWDSLETEKETRTMSIAKAYGFNDREELEQFLSGDLDGLDIPGTLQSDDDSELNTAVWVQNQNVKTSFDRHEPKAESIDSDDSGIYSDTSINDEYSENEAEKDQIRYSGNDSSFHSLNTGTDE